MIEKSLSPDLFEATRLLLQKVASRTAGERETIILSLYAAAQYHGTQLRKSGEPFIIHPIHVATILAWAGADTPSIAAGLLHDVLEDTEAPPDELRKRFGVEIFNLVEAVTRQPMFSMKEFLEKVYAKSRQDPRVAAIKIADQCSNHMNGSQLIFPLAKHHEHLMEMDQFYLPQIAAIPDVPKELVKLLGRINADSWNHYHNRTK